MRRFRALHTRKRARARRAVVWLAGAAVALAAVIAQPRAGWAQTPGTFTPIETFTPFRTFTPDQTFTPFRTFTPIKTFTPLITSTVPRRSQTPTPPATAATTGTATVTATPTGSTPTRTRTRTRTPPSLPSATAIPGFCSGDCDGDDAVTIDELITSVLAALDLGSLGLCPSVDTNADLLVTIDELITAVNQALAGCP
jgi:hypothetical protein